MAIRIECPCGKTLKLADEAAGQRVRCPACGSILPIPEPDDPPSGPVAGPAPPTPRAVALRFGPLGTGGDAPEPAPAPASTWRPAPEAGAGPRPVRGPARFDPEMDDRGASPREYLYWALILAFIPLGFSLLGGKDDAAERFARTMQANAHALGGLPEGASKADLLSRLPGGRIEGALLAHDSAAHWLFAVMSASAFLALLLMMFPKGDTRPGHLLAVGLFTATVGILFLLGVQFAAVASGHVRHVHGKGAILVLILMFIGFSYQAALNPENGFLLSALGFTCGVGLCEELCKALPLLWIYRRSGSMTWRQACLWGLASGVGFGVAEGIMYAGDKYNGVSTGGVYLVRFISCVALHAIWGASVGMTLDRRQGLVQGDIEPAQYGLSLVRIVAVPMVLHGLYDTLLKKDMNVYALGIAALSFAWLAWQVERARGAEDAKELGRGAWA